MLEIVILPYMAVSFAICWAIFSPFSIVEDWDSFSFARPEIIDFLALFVPLSFMLTILIGAFPNGSSTAIVLISAFVGVIVFIFLSLVAGLYLIGKLDRTSSLERFTIQGIVIPFGSLLSIAWIAIPIWAYFHSILYPMPAMLLICGATILMRKLSGWVCRRAQLENS